MEAIRLSDTDRAFENVLACANTGALELAAIQAVGTLYSNSNILNRVRQMARDVELHIDNPTLPWLAGSVNSRYSYTFKEGFSFSGNLSRLEEIRRCPQSKDFLTQKWLEALQRTFDTTGNIFLVEDVKTKQIFHMPLKKIANIYLDDNNEGYITHLKINPAAGARIYGYANRTNTLKPYIIARHNNTISNRAFYAKIRPRDDTNINPRYVFYDFHAARKFSEALASPPLLLSLFYCVVAARDFADTSRWRHSNSLIAVKIVGATEEIARKAVDRVSASERSGAVAGFGESMAVTGMGANALNVANNSSMPYLAAAAASVNIPVGQYTMTTQGLGGTAGSLVTLDAPKKAYYESQSGAFIDFFKEILGDDCEMSLKTSSEDSDAKQSSVILSSVSQGIVHPDEARAFVIDTYGVTEKHDDVPTIEERQRYLLAPSQGLPTAVTRDSGHDSEANTVTGGES